MVILFSIIEKVHMPTAHRTHAIHTALTKIQSFLIYSIKILRSSDAVSTAMYDVRGIIKLINRNV